VEGEMITGKIFFEHPHNSSFLPSKPLSNICINTPLIIDHWEEYGYIKEPIKKEVYR